MTGILNPEPTAFAVGPGFFAFGGQQEWYE